MHHHARRLARVALLGAAALAAGCGDTEVPGPVAPLPGGQPGGGRIQGRAVEGGVVGQEAHGGQGRGGQGPRDRPRPAAPSPPR